MTSPKTIDYFLLTTLALIWASAFFNIKIATYSYGPITIAFLRILFGAIPVVILCLSKNIKIIKGGKERSDSSYLALKYIKRFNVKNVLIHDAARPNFSINLMKKIIRGLNRHQAVVPFINSELVSAPSNLSLL